MVTYEIAKFISLNICIGLRGNAIRTKFQAAESSSSGEEDF